MSLNTLNYVNHIRASINTNYGTISRTWNLSQIIDEVSYLDRNLIYHQNDAIKIPLPSLPNLTEQNLHNFINFSKVRDSKDN